MPARGYRKPVLADTKDPEGLVAWTQRFIDDMRVKGYSVHSLTGTRGYLHMFAEWAHARGVNRPTEVTKELLGHYQRALFYKRKPNGSPLTLSSQRVRLQKVRNLLKWLAKTDVLPFNPASELELPRLERRLPRAVFSEKEVEQVLAIPDLETPMGLRDRAMMEVLCSTGIRRAELAALTMGDVDDERGTVTVRQGKNRKDRVVPIGARALAWAGRYMDEVRPTLVVPPGHPELFLTERGKPIKPARLTQLMRRYIDQADLGKTGACHVFRHTMATLMLEGGADVRLIQEILGHAELSTTEIYTRVNIKHLKAVHARTHPGANLGGQRPVAPTPELTSEHVFAVLEAEAREE